MREKGNWDEWEKGKWATSQNQNNGAYCKLGNGNIGISGKQAWFINILTQSR